MTSQGLARTPAEVCCLSRLRKQAGRHCHTDPAGCEKANPGSTGTCPSPDLLELLSEELPEARLARSDLRPADWWTCGSCCDVSESRSRARERKRSKGREAELFICLRTNNQSWEPLNLLNLLWTGPGGHTRTQNNIYRRAALRSEFTGPECSRLVT